MLNKKKTLNELKEISNRLNLDFNKDWFKFVWVTKEQQVLISYLNGCPRPDHNKYGKDVKERSLRIDEFFESNEYASQSKTIGGQVVYRERTPQIRDFANYSENKKIKEILLDFCKRVDYQIGDLKKISLLTESENKVQDKMLTEILSHEWVHVLLEQNNIRSENWKYNEGLVTYIDHYSRNQIEDLERVNKIAKDPYVKTYYENAILFRDLLKDTKDENKIEKIKEFISK